MAGGDHALDRDRTLGDEQRVPLDRAASGSILELAVVREPGIICILDPLRHSSSLVPGSDEGGAWLRAPPNVRLAQRSRAPSEPGTGRVIPRLSARLTASLIRANIERMFWQGSLFGICAPQFDVEFTDVNRQHLDATSWVDHGPCWLRGSDQLLDELKAVLPLRQRTGVRMYDRIVSEPRLTHWWQATHARPEPLPMLRDMRLALAAHYDEPFDSIGFNLYRDGNDSVAWHSDRHAKIVTNPTVVIVSLGAPRPFRMRPK